MLCNYSKVLPAGEPLSVFSFFVGVAVSSTNSTSLSSSDDYK